MPAGGSGRGAWILLLRTRIAEGDSDGATAATESPGTRTIDAGSATSQARALTISVAANDSAGL